MAANIHIQRLIVTLDKPGKTTSSWARRSRSSHHTVMIQTGIMNKNNSFHIIELLILFTNKDCEHFSRIFLAVTINTFSSPCEKYSSTNQQLLNAATRFLLILTSALPIASSYGRHVYRFSQQIRNILIPSAKSQSKNGRNAYDESQSVARI